MRTPPALAGLVGQSWITTIRGVVTSAHVAEALFVTLVTLQLSLPRAVTVLLTVQALAGAVKRAVKLLDTPGARLARLNTVLGEA